MNSKRQPTVWANDFCDQHGLDRVCPDDLALAHHAFHCVVIVPCHLTDLRLLQDGAIHAPRVRT